METKILTLRYSADRGAIDDTPLLALSRDHEILGMREHFFVAQELPHLVCIVSCRRRPAAAAACEPTQKSARDPDTRQQPSPDSGKRSASPPPDFNDEQRRLYDVIRRWRAEQAERSGVPRYVVLTNRDVELLVRRRPATLAALRRLPGIGEAKINHYGEALLALLRPADAGPRLVAAELPRPRRSARREHPRAPPPSRSRA